MKTYLAEDPLTDGSSGHSIAPKYFRKSVRLNKRLNGTPSGCFPKANLGAIPKGGWLFREALKEMLFPFTAQKHSFMQSDAHCKILCKQHSNT